MAGRASGGKPAVHWAAVLIILVAAYLRLAAFHEALIGGDQSSLLSGAAELASLRSLPLAGMKSSVGIWQTAVTSYIAAIPLLLVKRTIAIKWFFSMLDLVALATLYAAVRRAVGRRAALVAACMYATNPWIVEFVRWIWYQSLVPTFATLAFSFFLILLARSKSKHPVHLAGALVCSALMGTVHVAAAPWAALLFAAGLIIAWRQRLWAGFWAGLGASVLLIAPYVRYLAMTSSLEIGQLLRTAGPRPAGPNVAAFALAGELLTGRGVLETPRSNVWAESVLQLPFVHCVLLLLFACSFLFCCLQSVRCRRHRGVLLFTAAWAALAPALYLPTGFYLLHVYLLFLFPAPLALLGAWVAGLLRSDSRVWRTVGTGLLAVVLLVSLWWTHLWAVRIGYEMKGQLRAPTRAWLMDAAVDEIDSFLRRVPKGEVIILTEFEGELSPFSWIGSFIASDRVRVAPAGAGLIIPPGPTCYMLGPGALEAQLEALPQQAIEQHEMAIPADPPWRFFCTSAGEDFPAHQAEWDNGVGLVRATIEGAAEPGGVLSIVSYWHLAEPPGQQYHFFNHLFLDGELAAQVDGPGVPGWYWREGDLLVTRFQLVLPQALEPGSYSLRTGLYGWPDLQRVLLADGSDSYELERWIMR